MKRVASLKKAAIASMTAEDFAKWFESGALVVPNEFTHGKEEKVSKSEFQEVLLDIHIGMAAGLKRDPIVILHIDGEELHEYINSPGFESDMILVYSETASSDGTICYHIVKALLKLGVDLGLPPISDPWVMTNIVHPALELCTRESSDDQ